MKLKKGDYVKVENINKDTFDALCAVAVRNGYVNLFAEKQIGNIMFIYDWFIYEGKFTVGNSSQQICSENLKNELTIEEWLFSDAPEWAEAVGRCENGNFTYFSNLEDPTPKCISISGGEIPSISEVICKKTKHSKFKIGDIAIYESQKVNIIHINKDIAWIEKGNDYELVNLGLLKKQDEHAINDIVKIMNEVNTAFRGKNKINLSFKDYAKAITKAGYKKH